jgi:acetolactate synthase-1/2/3 large subunit
MPKISGGELLCRALKKEGVRYVFGLPGAQLATFMDAIARDYEMKFIMTRHEASAAMMADGWSRITGQPGVCCGTVGPGATNLVGGVGNAYHDSSPIVVITPNVQSFRAYPFKESIQALNQYDLFKPITKWNAIVWEWDRIPEMVQRAFREALSGRPGPVHLDIPVDILFEWKDEIPLPEPHEYRPIGRIRAQAELVKKVVELLAKAERPLLLAGGGVLRSQAMPELREVAEYLCIPVITTVSGAGSLPADHPLWVGDSGWLGGDAVVKAIKEADVVLALGCRFSEWIGLGKPPIWPESGQKIVHVDIDPRVIGMNVRCEIGIVSDAKAFLEDMLQILERDFKRFEGVREWVKELKETHQRYMAQFEAEEKAKSPITYARVMKELRDFLSRDAIVAYDGGQTMVWAMTYLRQLEPQGYGRLDGSGLGQLGFGLPMAIAAKLARPHRQVVDVTGDGSFMITACELETAVRYNVPVVVVICHDNAWGLVKALQESLFERTVGVDFVDVDYSKLAQVLGCYGERVTDGDEIRGALQRAFDAGKPAVLDIPVKYSRHPVDKYWGYCLQGCFRGLPAPDAIGAPKVIPTLS